LANAPLESMEPDIREEKRPIIDEKKVQPDQQEDENGVKPINPYSSMFIFGTENWFVVFTFCPFLNSKSQLLHFYLISCVSLVFGKAFTTL
jgi:hypothetical protein